MSPGHIEGLQNLVDPGSICWTRNELDLEQASKASCVIALCGWQGRYTGITAVIFKSTGPLSLYGHQFSFPSNCQFFRKNNCLKSRTVLCGNTTSEFSATTMAKKKVKISETKTQTTVYFTLVKLIF